MLYQGDKIIIVIVRKGLEHRRALISSELINNEPAECLELVDFVEYLI